MKDLDTLIKNGEKFVNKIEGYNVEIRKIGNECNIYSFDWDRKIRSFYNWIINSDYYISAVSENFNYNFDRFIVDPYTREDLRDNFNLFEKRYSSTSEAKKLCEFILPFLLQEKGKAETLEKKKKGSNVLEKVEFYLKGDKVMRVLLNNKLELGKTINSKLLYHICKNRNEKFINKIERDNKYKNMFVDKKGTIKKFDFKNLDLVFGKKEEGGYYFITFKNTVEIVTKKI